ncbi:hypothetical protein FB451DRAFT_636518 [Mycena latifolia]|nr:hypothetical protein FB451DRAFT_636518 [Mycena latifolia]
MKQPQIRPPQCLFNICVFVLQAAGETSEKLSNCDRRALIAPWLGLARLLLFSASSASSSYGSTKCGKCDFLFSQLVTAALISDRVYIYGTRKH